MRSAFVAPVAVRLLAALAAAVVAAGCGVKGPLTLPKDPAKSAPAASSAPAGAAPAGSERGAANPPERKP